MLANKKFNILNIAFQIKDIMIKCMLKKQAIAALTIQ